MKIPLILAVSTLLAAPPAKAPPAPVKPAATATRAPDWTLPELTCSGSEPFWTLEVGRGSATFKRPDAPDVSLPKISLRTALNASLLESASGTIVIKQGQCTGEGPFIFPYDVTYFSKDFLYSGCCAPKGTDVRTLPQRKM